MARKTIALLAAALLTAALAPASSGASHCSDLIILSGVARIPDNPVTIGGLNAGASGCNVEGITGVEAVNTNYLFPRATFLVVATPSGAPQPTNGKVRFDDGPMIALAWHAQALAPSGSRWISQDIAVPGDAQSVTATARLDSEAHEVTYQRSV